MMLLFVGGRMDGEIIHVAHGHAPPEIVVPCGGLRPVSFVPEDGGPFPVFIPLRVARYERAERWSTTDPADAAVRYRFTREEEIR